MYVIEFSKKAEKQFYKLEINLQKRIIDTLERIKIRPHSFVKKLVNSKYSRLRVGEHRIILDIREKKLLVFVVELGHRKNIYN